MSKLWSVVKKEGRVLLRDKGSLIQLFIIPIVIITVASFALGGTYTLPTDIVLPVADLDKTDMSNNIVKALKEIPVIQVQTEQEGSGEPKVHDEGSVRDLVKRKEVAGAIIIPKGFREKIYGGRSADLIFLENPVEQIKVEVLKNVLNILSVRLSANIIAVKLSMSQLAKVRQGSFDEKFIQEIVKDSNLLWENQPVKVAESPVEKFLGDGLNAMKQNVPGFAVMFSLFMISWGGISLLNEKEQGTASRILSAPVSTSAVVAGKLFFTFLISCMQLFVFFAFGHFVFGMDLGNSLLGLVLLSMSLAFVASSFALLLASVSRSTMQLGTTASMIIMGMSAMGGSWWPSEFMPKIMQKISYFVTINSWAMDGYKDLLWYGRGVESILPEMGVILGIGVAAFFGGVFRYRLE